MVRLRFTEWFSKMLPVGFYYKAFHTPRRLFPFYERQMRNVAGLGRMHPIRMTLYVILGTLIWNSLLVYFGLMVGENWQLVTQILKAYNRAILVLLIAGAVSWYIVHRRRKVRTASAVDSEVPGESSDSSER